LSTLPVVVDDLDKKRLVHRRVRGDNEEYSVTSYAPVDLFLGEADERDVLRNLTRELYAFTVKKRGWPAPPGAPEDSTVQPT
jgi:hypothetical protein